MNSANNLAQVRTNILCIHKYIKTYLFFWSQKLCGNNMHLNYRLNSLCNIPTIDYARKKSSRVILSDVEGLPTRFLWGLEAIYRKFHAFKICWFKCIQHVYPMLLHMQFIYGSICIYLCAYICTNISKCISMLNFQLLWQTICNRYKKTKQKRD